MSLPQTAKFSLAGLAGAAITAGGLLLLSPPDAPERVELDAPVLLARTRGPTEFSLAGLNLQAASGCLDVPGCTADVWATRPDGGVVRLQLLGTDAGTFTLPDGGLRELVVDGGAGDIQ